MKIHQIYYDEHSHSKISTLFTPYDNTNPEREGEFEYGVMRKLYSSHNWDQDSHLGVFSWKFFDKIESIYNNYYRTNISVDRPTMVKRIHDSTDYDVIMINPWINLTGQNVWGLGNHYHPGLYKRTQSLLERCDIKWDLFKEKHDASNICYCNYWVANKKFWDTYMGYTERIYGVYREDGIDPYFPYIMERLFTSILYNHYEQFKVAKISQA